MLHVTKKKIARRTHLLDSRDRRIIIRKIIRIINENPQLSAPQLRSELYQETGENVRVFDGHLKESGYNGRIVRRKPYVNKINRRKRLNFAKEYLSKEREW